MNLFDYLERNTATFDERPFNPVDSAVLSQFCMVRVKGVAPDLRVNTDERLAARPKMDAVADRAYARSHRPAHFSDFLDVRHFEDMFSGLDPENVKRELVLLVANPRFKNLKIRDYSDVFDEASHTQFAAMTFTWKNEWAYVGFRGTDESFAGWRENFNMVVDPPVPAQRMAVEYLESVARHLPRRLYVGGHSKGGNLATYAALRCSKDVQSRIECLFDHDGPGFKSGFLSKEDFLQLAGRIDRTVPQSSVVGQLLQTYAPTRVVHIEGNAEGFQQHSVFTWDVDDGMREFQCVDQLDDSAKFTHDVLNEWIDSIDEEKLPDVIDALFRTIEASGAENAGEFFSGDSDMIGLILEVARNMDDDTREILVPELTRFATIAASHTVRSVRKAWRRKDSK